MDNWTRSSLSLKEGLKDGLAIGLGYFPVSFTFGILAVGQGLSWWQATFLSLLNLTSAGQFAGLDIMAQGGSLIEMALTQLVVNIRYSLMSIVIGQKADDTTDGWHRFLIPYTMTDEIFGVAAGKGQPVGFPYWVGLSTLPVIGWTAGTLAGSLLGQVLPQRLSDALGIALYAMFIAIIIPAAKKYRPVWFCIVVAAALACLFHFIPFLSSVSSGFTVIICGVSSAALCAWLFPVKEEEL